MELTAYCKTSCLKKAPVHPNLLAMKLTAIFLLIGSLHVSAVGFTQKLTISGSSLPLEKVFSIIHQQTGYKFIFDSEDLKNIPAIDLSVREAPLTEVLNDCLSRNGLTYIIRYNTIIIRGSKLIPVNPLPRDPALILLKGVVKNERGDPLEGASILLQAKGFKRGIVTLSTGEFRLPNTPPGNYTLQVSMIGYETYEHVITLNENTPILSIVLHKGIIQSEKNFVVNGIYQRPAQNYTGAAQSYTAEQLRQVSNTSVFTALRSLDASFQMPSDINFGSDPNHLPQIQLRGSNSVANTNLTSQYGYISNPPLLILDGFEVSMQKLFDLDMNRIKKVTILKDAAATSIYGSRAANGVLVVETVQPEKGRLRLSYNNNLSINTPDLTSYHLLDAPQKLQLEQVAGIYRYKPEFGQAPVNQLALNELYDQRLAEVKRGVNTYWLSQPLATEFSQKHSIYLDGGDDYMRYGIDLSYNNNTGVMKGSKRENYSGGISLTYHKDKLQFTNYLSISYNKGIQSPYGEYANYSILNPYWRRTDSTGHIPKVLQQGDPLSGVSTIYNPMYDVTLNTVNNSSYINVTENFQADWNIRKELKLSARFSLNSQKNSSNQFLPADAVEFATVADSLFSTRGAYAQLNGTAVSTQGDIFLNYGKTFGRNVLFATAGAHIQQDKFDSTTTAVQGFPNSNMNDILFGLQYPKNSVPTGSEGISRLLGYYGNASYAYDNRYLLDLSFRTDGSSLFGTNKHYAPFWSAGGGWNLHKEHFFHLPAVINRLKIRASYGSTGSQNFPAYASLQTYSYLIGSRYLNNVGTSLLGLGNPNLQWQQTNKMNLGADLEIYKGYMQATFNYYNKKTNNLFTSINTVPSSGFNSYYANLGNVQNRGVELYLTLFAIKKEHQNIFWSFYGNIFHNENKLLKISDALKAQNDKATGKQSSGVITAPVLLYKEGQSISSIYAVRSLGIDPSTGNEVFLTKDGIPTYRWDPRDEVVVGDNQPVITGNFGTNLMYKGITINISMHTELGGQMYNGTLANMVENADLNFNVDSRVLSDRWQKPGDIASYKGLTDINGITRTDITRATSRFVEKNNNLYCDAISLGYLFPSHLTERWKMSRLQTLLYINSPFVISSIRQEKGLIYPFARSFSFSLQMGF